MPLLNCSAWDLLNKIYQSFSLPANKISLKLLMFLSYSDEKWWVLHPKKNKQNDRFWAPVNPRHYNESKVQGDVKVKKSVESTLRREDHFLRPCLAQGRLNIHPAFAGIGLSRCENRVALSLCCAVTASTALFLLTGSSLATAVSFPSNSFKF